MNPVLAQVYGLDKTASEEDGQVTLDSISAEDLLAAHEAGEVDINELLNFEGEKTAGEEEEIDLSQFSNDELAEALAGLEGGEKIASDEEQYWDAAGRQMARSYADELTKQASTEIPMDLNELSAEELIGLAYELTDEMDKTASYDDEDVDLNAFTPDEIIELAYHLENGGYEKTAGAYDLNELSVDEFIDFAVELEKEAGAATDFARRQGAAGMARLRAMRAKGGEYAGRAGKWMGAPGRSYKASMLATSKSGKGKGRRRGKAALTAIRKNKLQAALAAAGLGGAGYGGHRMRG